MRRFKSYWEQECSPPDHETKIMSFEITLKGHSAFSSFFLRWLSLQDRIEDKDRSCLRRRIRVCEYDAEVSDVFMKNVQNNIHVGYKRISSCASWNHQCLNVGNWSFWTCCSRWINNGFIYNISFSKAPQNDTNERREKKIAGVRLHIGLLSGRLCGVKMALKLFVFQGRYLNLLIIRPWCI